MSEGKDDAEGSSTDRDEFVFFNRIEEGKAEEPETTGGVFSSFLSRIWRADEQPQQSPLPSSSNLVQASLSVETGPPPGSENGSPALARRPHLTQKSAEMSPSSTSMSSDTESTRKFSNRLASIFKGGNGKDGLVDYNRSNFKQYWMPDSTGRECYQCEERFTAFRRRHHCRLCGQIFCAKCCNVHVPGSTLGYTGDLRLCHYCAKMMAQYLPPEADHRNPSEELVPSGSLPLGTISSIIEDPPADQTGSPRQNGGVISTVSGGNLMWSRGGEGNQPPRVERKDSLSLPPSSYKPPTMLCVQELYNQHEQANGGKPRAMSLSNTLCDEEESGPDWFRNMSSSHSSFVRDDKIQPAGASLSLDDFEPQPIEPESGSSDDDVNVLAPKQPLSQKLSTPLPSPVEPADDDINHLFLKRTERMVDYLFNRERIRDSRWRSIVLSLSKKIAETVTVDVERRRDSMNILSYVHIKKVVVEVDAPSAEPYWGVVCSKSVLHSSMSFDQKNASVMIIAGSIEYERVQGKLTSIEPILCQEAEFLSKQVDRIMTRRPSLLLVEGGVSRIAANLLRKQGVAVVVHCKANVLHRIARSTGADILPSSDAQLIQQNVGFCPSFRQHAKTLKNGQKKIFLIFDECLPDRGCSVVLRGNDERELRAVKRILQLMIKVVYSSNLEKAYLNLFNLRLAHQISNCEVCEVRRNNIEHLEEKSVFEDELEKSVLGVSPFVEFDPPYLETPQGRTCSLRNYFKQPLYRFGTDEDFDLVESWEREEIQEKDVAESVEPPRSTPRHNFSVKKAVSEGGADLAAFRATGGMLFRKRIQKEERKTARIRKQRSLDIVRRNDVLCPFVHQRIAVLFGSFSPKSPNSPYFCVRPWVLSMDFYDDHDMTLGEFLTKYCFNKSYECPSSNCEIPMLDHSRKLVFGRVCVEVTTQLIVNGNQPDENGIAAQSYNGNIVTWHYCPTCKASSPVVPFTFPVRHLSFGKYLDYIANSAFTKGCVSSPSIQHQCSHCYFHQQTHFFAQSNFVTTVKVTPIRPFDVVFSPVVCHIQPQQFSRQALLDGVTRMAALADDVIRTAEDRLKIFVQHEQFTLYAGTFHTVLRSLVEKTQTLVSEKRQYADQLRGTDKAVISSNDIYAIKANETMMYIREAIYTLITTWNDQSLVLGATVRAARKEEPAANAETTEISLDKIDDPFPSHLHLGLKLQPRVGVIVRDIQDSRGNYKPDIGSIIAYALSAVDYEEGRRKARTAAGGEVPLNLNSDSLPADEEAVSAEHLEVEFQDQSSTYYVKAYFAERFKLLRKLLFAEGEEAFVRSLSQSVLWTPQGGKSGSFFYKTQDDRFIMKQMGRYEIQSFAKFAPNYFEYVKTAVVENKLTTLCKVYGVFRVGVKSKTTQLKVDILVMEYLFYKHSVNQVWDLKGSLRNRLASGGNNPEDVLLDENLMKDLWNKQLYVYPHAKAALNQAISNDSHFLSAQHIMDYSLLVGVDETSGQLLLGIVDYMRTYTLDKKVESWVKMVAVPGAHLPTILSPEMYCTRFSEAIDTYFPVVPDQWTGLGSSVSY